MNPVELNASRLLQSIRRRSLHGVLAALLLTGAGCSEKVEPKAQRQAPPPPSAPAPVQVSLESIPMHEKVQFPEERAPTSPEVAEAIAQFASAIASGADDRIQSMLAERDRMLLGSLVQSGEWRRQTESIEIVRVCALNELDSGRFQVGFGVQDSTGAFLSAWESNGAGDSWTFTGFAAPPRFSSAASDLDGIALTEQVLPDAKPVESKISAPEPPPEEEESAPEAPQRSGGLVKDRR